VNRCGIVSACLGGPLPGKMTAWRGAHGNAIEICREDLAGLRDSQIRPALGDMRVLDIGPLQWGGLPPDLEEDQRTIVAGFLGDARYWNAKAVLVCASTHLRTIEAKITGDLQKLASWAGQSGLDVWYEALPWSRWDRSLEAAWRRVELVDRPNFHLMIDTWHDALCGGDPDFVRRLVQDKGRLAKIGCVQIADYAGPEPPVERLIIAARNERDLPGEGWMTRHMITVMRYLADAGYEGAYSAEVRNRRWRATDPDTAAEKIRNAMGSVTSACSD